MGLFNLAAEVKRLQKKRLRLTVIRIDSIYHLGCCEIG